MAWRLHGTKALPKPIKTFFQLDPTDKLDILIKNVNATCREKKCLIIFFISSDRVYRYFSVLNESEMKVGSGQTTELIFVLWILFINTFFFVKWHDRINQ